jgi:hypothetical protein
MNINEIFEKYADDYCKFRFVEFRRSKRPDIHAFLLLDEIVPGDTDMVSAAEHDEIYLSVSPEDLGRLATESQILDLIRCGVRLDRSTDSLAMFV